MLFIPKNALGWLLIVLGIVIGGFCAWGVLSGRVVETRDSAIGLIWGSAGMVVLGVLYNLIVVRKKG